MRKNFKAELKKLREENEQLKKENVYLKNRLGLLEAQRIMPVIPYPVPVRPYLQYPNFSPPYANPFWC